MEWELLYMCNIIGFLIIVLIFAYHIIGTEADDSKPKSKSEKVTKDEKADPVEAQE